MDNKQIKLDLQKKMESEGFTFLTNTFEQELFWISRDWSKYTWYASLKEVYHEVRVIQAAFDKEGNKITDFVAVYVKGRKNLAAA